MLLRVLVRYTLITCISNISSLTLPVFLSASYFGEVPLLVIFPFAMGALSLGFGFNFGFLCGSSNYFAVLLEVPLLSLALRETSDLINHQHLMLPSLISTSTARSIANSLGIFSILCLFIVHHKDLVA